MRRQRADLSLPIGRSPFMAPEIWDACAARFPQGGWAGFRSLRSISVMRVHYRPRATGSDIACLNPDPCRGRRQVRRTSCGSAWLTSAYVPIEQDLLDRALPTWCRFTIWPKAFVTCIRCLRLVRRLNDRGRPDLYSASSRVLEPTTYRARITCNSSPGAGCARNGLLWQPPFWTATAFSFRKSLPRWATMKFCSTAAPTMALWLRPFCAHKGNFLAGS